MSEEQKKDQNDINEQDTALSDEQLEEAAGGTDSDHKDWINLLSVSSTIIRPTTTTESTDDPEITTRS